MARKEICGSKARALHLDTGSGRKKLRERLSMAGFAPEIFIVSDDRGYWFHMGRSDDCFKSSGQWVSPVEVEGVLVRHENVARVAVVEDFDERSLPCACAFVVSSESRI